jgi:uncharacterized MAPEG superfamily protein
MKFYGITWNDSDFLSRSNDMTIPFWCLFISIIIPYPLATLGGYFRRKQLGALDNHYPRIQSSRLEGVGARVYAAQQNAWEAAIVFATAVFTAHLSAADAQMSAILAIAFVIFRILHAIFYIADLATLRSLIFVLALLCCLGLYVLAMVA